MQITQVRIENIKAFGARHQGLNLNFESGAQDVPRWIVVAGRNGAGKSTLLRSIALAIAGPNVSRGLVKAFAGWIRDDETEANVAVKLRFTEEDYFTQGGRRPKFEPWTAIQWKRQESGPEPSMERLQTGGSWTPSRGPWDDNAKGWFVAGYGPFRRLSSAAIDAQRMMLTPGRQASLVSLFREEATLSEAVLWLKQIYLRRLERKVGAQEQETSLLALLNDGLLPEGFSILRVDSDGLWIRSSDGSELALDEVSDGYRTVAALVLDLTKQLQESFGYLTFDSPTNSILNEGVVLIDELDVHLHVSWQREIGFWLKRHFPNLQFIVSTHSPFICQAADRGGLVRLAPPGSGEESFIVDGELFNRVVNGSIDEALVTDLFGLESAYSARSEALRDEVAEIESVALNRRLSEAELSKLSSLKGELPDTLEEDARAALTAILTQAAKL